MWVAWLNLEAQYGEPPGEAAMALFHRALPYNSPKALHFALLDVLQCRHQVTDSGLSLAVWVSCAAAHKGVRWHWCCIGWLCNQAGVESSVYLGWRGLMSCRQYRCDVPLVGCVLASTVLTSKVGKDIRSICQSRAAGWTCKPAITMTVCPRYFIFGTAL